MTNRAFQFEFVVYVTDDSQSDPGPEGLLDIAREHVSWRRVSRQSSPELFSPPKLAPDPEGTLWSAMSADLATELATAIERAKSAWVISCDRSHEDLSPLQVGMGLASAALQSGGGIAVVDRETSVIYDAEDFIDRADQLNEDGDITFCDLVLIETEASGENIRMRTRGLRKFGHRDLVIEDLASRYRDFGTWLFTQALGDYVALRKLVAPGENFAYTRADSTAKLFFGDGGEGLLLVSDCHPTDKRAIEGLRMCVATLYPTFLYQHHQMTAADEEADDEVEPKIESVEDYAGFTQLLHDGEVEQAFQTFGVTWETLGPVTYQWTGELAEREAQAAFLDRVL